MSAGWARSKDPILSSLQDVVSIDSVNPELPGGLCGEAGMIEYLCQFFDRADISYETVGVLEGRSNVIATLPGADPDRILLFECHMDTAAVGNMDIPPFEPHIRDGRLYGRGSCDTKAGGVAMMHAMKRLRESGVTPAATIQYAGAVDEERLYRGAQHLAARTRATAAVVSEPTDLEVVRAHKGLARFRILVKGTAAHSSKPHLGTNAITKMARLVCAFEDAADDICALEPHPLTGGPTFSIGIITGGTQVNFIPDRCTIELDRRVIPGERPLDSLAAFQEVVDSAKRADPELDVTIEEPFLVDEPMETGEGERIVHVAADACRQVLGDGMITGVPYGTDASKFSHKGIPSIVLGPGSIDQAHTAVEWVESDQVLRAVDIYERIMLDF